jgi:hypothetical protein
MLLPLSARLTPGESASLQPTKLGYTAALLAAFMFKERMAAQGWVVDARRLLSDPAYAADQVALGHTSACAKLRASAVRLFSIYGA